MTAFSANLGFLWREQPLPQAIRLAAAAGFDAVECHWPFDEDREAIRQALDETGLPLISLNTRRGRVDAGENGLAALAGRQDEACIAVDEALEWASVLGARAVHIMAGVAEGPQAEAVFIDNLRAAAAKAAAMGLMIIIEPLNPWDAPGYFLRNCDQAAAIITAVGADNLKLMFDCYHVARIEGDVIPHLDRHRDMIGHIQFAGVPDRGRPDQGEVDYAAVFAHLAQLGYTAPLGAEYTPEEGDTAASLGWMERF